MLHAEKEYRSAFAFGCHFILECYANVSVFSREIKEPPTYLSSKNKKIRDRVDSRVQFVWRLRVMGSCMILMINKSWSLLGFKGLVTEK